MRVCIRLTFIFKTGLAFVGIVSYFAIRTKIYSHSSYTASK